MAQIISLLASGASPAAPPPNKGTSLAQLAKTGDVATLTAHVRAHPQDRGALETALVKAGRAGDLSAVNQALGKADGAAKAGERTHNERIHAGQADRHTTGDVHEAPQRTQTPTSCQRAFLKKQLASRGLPTGQIDQLRFVSGLDGNANAVTRLAFQNAAAVTQGTTVYVQPSRFNEIANFRSPVGFEEAYHTGQFALYGAGTFYDSYGVMSAGAKLLGLGARGGNLIEQFAEGASRVMYSNYQGSECPK